MKASSFKLPEITRKEFLLWLVGRRKRMKVTGASMFPILKPGDEVLIDVRSYRARRPEVGDIVVSAHPAREQPHIIKRVSMVHQDGSVNLQGENPFETTDFNRVPPGKIIGRVTCIFFTAQTKPENGKQKG